jgi:hypothetical protein
VVVVTKRSFKFIIDDQNLLLATVQACVEDFRTAFPNFPVKYPKLVQMLENPFENMKQRVNSCIEAGGRTL